MTSFLGIKGAAIFSKNDRTDQRQFFFFLSSGFRKTLVYYNLHWKAMHPAFKPDSQRRWY